MNRLKVSLMPLAVLLLAGCAAILPGNDPVVVEAERTISASFETVNTFLKLESDNRAAYKAISPEIFNAAEYLRKNFPGWYDSAVAVKTAYKANRTADNKAQLQTYVALLTQSLQQAQKYLVLTAGKAANP